jgi:hypothetical protein
VKLADQRLRGSEIRRIKALGKPIMDWREQLKRLLCPALVAPQPGEAGGGAQFPGEGTLMPRPVDSF